MSDQDKLPTVFGKPHADLLAIAANEGVSVGEGVKYKDLQAAILANREANPVTVQTGENSGGVQAAAPTEPAPIPPAPTPAPPAAKDKTPTYWVTAGNIVHGTDGLRRLGGEPVKLDSDDAAVLLKAKVITKEQPEAEGDDE